MTDYAHLTTAQRLRVDAYILDSFIENGSFTHNFRRVAAHWGNRADRDPVGAANEALSHIRNNLAARIDSLQPVNSQNISGDQPLLQSGVERLVRQLGTEVQNAREGDRHAVFRAEAQGIIAEARRRHGSDLNVVRGDVSQIMWLSNTADEQAYRARNQMTRAGISSPVADVAQTVQTNIHNDVLEAQALQHAVDLVRNTSGYQLWRQADAMAVIPSATHIDQGQLPRVRAALQQYAQDHNATFSDNSLSALTREAMEIARPGYKDRNNER